MAAIATPETRARSRRRRRMTLSRRFESAGPLTYLFLLGLAIWLLMLVHLPMPG